MNTQGLWGHSMLSSLASAPGLCCPCFFWVSGTTGECHFIAGFSVSCFATTSHLISCFTRLTLARLGMRELDANLIKVCFFDICKQT